MQELMSKEPPVIRRKIGKMVYEVSIHFSGTSTENVQDKLKRMILNDCAASKKYR